MSTLTLKVCPDQTRELIMDWLKKNGTMDELVKAFVTELAPYATSAVERALKQNLLKNDLTLKKLQAFLNKTHCTIQGVLLNPDMIAVAQDSEAELYELMIALTDWIRFLEIDPLTPVGQAAKVGGI